MTTPTSYPHISYFDPDGVEWDLSDMSLSNGYICSVISGVEGVPISFTTIPMIDGSVQPQMYISQPGSIILSILVEAKSSDRPGVADYYKLLDRIVYAFFNKRSQAPAPGNLVISRPDGTSRKLPVYCVSGLNQPEVGVLKSHYVLGLESPDPHWYDLVANVVTYKIGGGSAGILPLLPIAISSSTVLGASTINNDGGTVAYPTWDITGPGTPIIANNTTGRSFTLHTPIASGHVVHVETALGKQMVVDTTTGTNLWNDLVFNSPRDLWSLAVGTNNINLSLGGSGSGSQIQLSWMRRWLRS